MEDLSKLVIDISARLTNLEKGLKDAEKLGSDSAKRIENTYKSINPTINNTLAKKSISEVEVTAEKLRATLANRMEANAPLGQLQNLQTALNKAEGAVATFKTKAEEPVKESGIFGNMGDKVAAFASRMLGVIAAMFAFQKVKQFVTDALGAFEEREQALLGVESVIKSMGKESEYTADGLLSMAKQLASMNKYSVKVTDILDLQSYLLGLDTMTRDLMPKASQTVIDLASKMKVDLVTAAKSVGIALEDPEGGLNRFRRSGIVFSDAQKEMIKTMVETGDKAGAQAKIFEVLEAKVGGYAKNTTTAWGETKNMLSVALATMERGIGSFIASALIPIGQSLLSLAPKDAIDEFNKLSASVKNTETNIVPLIGVYSTLMSKANLNKEEHQKLQGAIEAISQAFPGAITKWDEYGRAIEISTGKLWDLINAEKERLKYTNSKAIQKTYDDQGKNLERMNALNFQMTKGTFTDAESGAILKYSDKEIADKNNELLQLGEKLKGIRAEYKRLTGGNIDTSAPKTVTTNTPGGKADSTMLEQQLAADEKALAIKHKLEQDAITDEYARKKKAIDDAYNEEIIKIDNKVKIAKAGDKEINMAAIAEEKKNAGQDKLHAMNQLNEENAKKELKLAQDTAKQREEYLIKFYADKNSIDKAEQDKLISNYDLSLADYKKYLDEQLDYYIETLKEKNKKIKEYNDNLQPGEDPLPEINTGNVKAAGQKENQSQLNKYSEGKYTKDLEEWKKHNRLLASMMETTTSSMTNTLNSQWSAAWEKMFGPANSVLQKLGQSLFDNILSRLTGNLLAGLIGIIMAPFTGGASMALAAAAHGHEGGSFIGTSKGVKKMSGGGSFTVPPKYDRDSFMMAVETDEVVDVTPADKARHGGAGSGMTAGDINRIVEAISVMDRNNIGKDTTPQVIIQSKIPGVQFTQKVIVKDTNRLLKNKTNIYES